jgi:hypothetical protein
MDAQAVAAITTATDPSTAVAGNPGSPTIAISAGVTMLPDGGYRSFPGATWPLKDSPGWRAAHKRMPARIEHVLARLKEWQVLRLRCRREDAIN